MTDDHEPDCPCWSCVSVPASERGRWGGALVVTGVALAVVVAGVGLLVGWLS